MNLVTANIPCRESGNARDKAGYARVFTYRFGKRISLAHVLAWVDEHGCLPPEDKPCILHRCDNPPCIEPAHLWAGTVAENNRDKAAKGRHHNQRKTRCRNGHSYTPANTRRTADNSRVCRKCEAAHQRAYYRRKKAMAA